MAPRLSTCFLPAGRFEADRIRQQAARLAASPAVAAIFQAAGGATAILNAERQIVAMNQAALDLIGEGAAEALGLRAGEALGCSHSHDGPDGCGTGAGCAGCGAAVATIVAEHQNRPEERDCVITVRRGDRRVDVDLRVRVTPFDLEGEPLLLLGVTDVSEERRRQILERSFTGDVLRKAAALRATSAVLVEPGPSKEALAQIRRLVLDLDRALQIHQALTAGVAGRLDPQPRTVAIADELTVLAQTVAANPAAQGRRLELLPPSPGEMMAVDPAMLQHVLVAMTLNALEATRAGGTVRVGVDLGEALASFRVWNAGVIPAVHVPRIFQRFFTTRGPGRGNGTWSMKFVGEELLRGEVGFRTSFTAGTTFWLTLPRRVFASA